MLLGDTLRTIHIPRALFRDEVSMGPFKHEDAPFRVEASSINVGGMIQELSKEIPLRASDAGARMMRSGVWGSFPSLRTFKDFESRFERITGAIALNDGDRPGVAAPSIKCLRDFFQDESRTYSIRGVNYNRGAAYYVARDPSLSLTEKIQSLAYDLSDAHHVIQSVNRRDLVRPSDYFAYLGVLDYLKTHSLTAYNALTFRERAGEFFEADTEYQFCKGLAIELARSTTESFYHCLLGLSLSYHISPLGSEFHHDMALEVCRYLNRRVAQGLLLPSHIKQQEVDHPIVIGLNAHENALRFPDTEVVIGLPFGGLQPSIVNRMMIELVHGRTPTLLTVPLSTHSGKEQNDSRISDDVLVKHFLRDSVRGRTVLVTEDNSNTGLTAHMIHCGVMKAGAREAHVSVAELDLVRVIMKQRMSPPADMVANLMHPDFESAIRIVPMRTRSDDPKRIGTQMVKLAAERVIASSLKSGRNAFRQYKLSEFVADYPEFGVRKIDFSPRN